MKRSFVRYIGWLLSVSLLMHSVVVAAQPALMSESSGSDSVSYQMEVAESEQMHDCCNNTVCYCSDACEQGSPCSTSPVFLSTSVFTQIHSALADGIIITTNFSYHFNIIETPKRPPRI